MTDIASPSPPPPRRRSRRSALLAFPPPMPPADPLLWDVATYQLAWAANLGLIAEPPPPAAPPVVPQSPPSPPRKAPRRRLVRRPAPAPSPQPAPYAGLVPSVGSWVAYGDSFGVVRRAHGDHLDLRVVDRDGLPWHPRIVPHGPEGWTPLSPCPPQPVARP